MILTRRGALAAIPILPVLHAPAAGQGLEPTPGCRDGAQPTAAQIEGPFFRAGAPLRRDLTADAPGAPRILLGGLVFDRACRPVAGAVVQIWHADDGGRYDVRGPRLRGQVRTDERGAWSFATIVTGAYPGRTRHYHFKVARPDAPILTTQLYFPDDPGNRRDSLFDPRLVLRLTDAGGLQGRFDFVII
jgi:protocatechuate 3,4-dioxygenase beta subunit